MIPITETISIDEKDLQFEFIKSSGPGGQNVNKVSSAVRLRFNLEEADSLPEAVKKRLYRLAAKRISKDGILTISARRHRRQERNRQEAMDRLQELLIKAARKPRKHKKTSVPLKSREERLESKKHRSRVKSLRKPPPVQPD